MTRFFWFQLIVYAAQMMIMIPGKLKEQHAPPIIIMHSTKPDIQPWFLFLFSVCYFYTNKDGKVSQSKNQANYMDGIAVRCSPRSNALLVYSPRNKKFYGPETYRLNHYQIPGSMYLDNNYDGCCSIILSRMELRPETYPPSTRIVQEDQTKRSIRLGSVMDIILNS